MNEKNLLCRWCGLEIEPLPNTDLFIDMFVGDRHCNQAPTGRAERHHMPEPDPVSSR